MVTSDQNSLMVAIGLSDSLDSSSDDIIPMQRRKKRGFPRRRNRGISPTSTLFKANYAYGFCTLIKFIFFTIVVTSITLSIFLMYNLYNRLDLLQSNIDELQSSKSNFPEELHLIHSHLKSLDQNSSQIRTELNYVSELSSNLTSHIAQIQLNIDKITEAIEEAPTIRQLPKDVEELKKIVADLGSKMTSDGKEVKLAREQQANFEVQFSNLNAKLEQLQNNLTLVGNQYLTNTKLLANVTDLQNQIDKLSNNLMNITTSIEQLNESQSKLENNHFSIQSEHFSNGSSSLTVPKMTTRDNSTTERVNVVKKNLQQQQLEYANKPPNM